MKYSEDFDGVSSEKLGSKVNLFLIGAQKSGSTSLVDLLRRCKQVSLPVHKAPNYFNTKFKKDFQIKSYKQYHGAFDHSKLYRCDASDCYHADRNALLKIKEYNPDAKIVMILRDPKKMLLSLYSHLRWKGVENANDASHAMMLEDARRRGKNLPAMCSDVNYLMYTQLCNIGDQVEFLSREFVSENLYFISLDDLNMQQERTLENLLERLGISEVDLDCALPNSNSKVVARSKILSFIFLLVPSWVKTRVKLFFGRFGINLDGITRKLNGKAESTSHVTNFVAKQEAFFAEQRAKVYAATGIQFK